MNPITINSVEYYNTVDLMNTDKDYFKCCKGKPRAIIEWKKIPDSEYIFSYQKDNQWVVSKKEYNKAYLLLTKTFCEANLPSMKVEPEVEEPKPQPKKTILKRVAKVKEAPPILQLADDEKFKDEEGRPLDIEVRGERSPHKIYFKVKDVAIAFEMINLTQTLNEENSHYVKNDDFDTFIVVSSTKSDKTKIKFLTYEGMLKVLYSSKCGKAKLFRKWATETLFTHQMGTELQKNNLACDLIGVPYTDLKKYLNIQSSDNTYCVYISTLGRVSALRTAMCISNDISDDKIVCKFGRTESLEKRIANHRSEFKHVNGVYWQLRRIAVIDPYHISKAETEIKNYVNKFKLYFENKEELIVVNESELKEVEDKLNYLRLLYAGSNQELSGTLEKANWSISMKDAQIQLLEAKAEHYKDIIRVKELERDMAELKLKMLESQLNK